ncbi:hypothetical protein HUT13_13000 [Streptomyces harbinensis]|uniref:hypothetical protein n=1 Tax=Streptomyces harbinensis TaxID=1176198 RepID=UPI00158FDE57|nr:hypothetical protein [Streptomyces harbinensis]QKV69597.1 hypothetical protein HUT13_13000 [Streptomyces harbinensis]
MRVPARDLTDDDHELIAYARRIVDTQTDGEDGVHTMGAAVRAADGALYGGINVHHFLGGPCAASLPRCLAAPVSGPSEPVRVSSSGRLSVSRSGARR